MDNINNHINRLDNLNDFSKLLVLLYSIDSLDEKIRKLFITTLLSHDYFTASDLSNLLIKRIQELNEDDLSNLLNEIYKELDKKYEDEIKR